jgi:hypothetical protein
MTEVGMSIASVEIVKHNLIFLSKLLLDHISRIYSQNTLPKITSTKTITKTYRDFPNILAKININIMMVLLVVLLYRAMQVKSIIKHYEIMLSVSSANWNLSAVISSIEMCNENSTASSRFKSDFYEESGFINGYGMISSTKNI